MKREQNHLVTAVQVEHFKLYTILQQVLYTYSFRFLEE